jgi:uncharacterized protein YybS (DUF2232 family)
MRSNAPARSHCCHTSARWTDRSRSELLQEIGKVLPGASGEKVKDLAIGIGVTSVLFTVTILSPILGFLCTFGIPLPTIVYRAKLGRKQGMLVPAGSLVILVLILGGISLDILYFLELLLIGYILYEACEQQVSVEATIGFTSFVAVLAGVIVLIVFSVTSETGIFSLVNGYIRKNLDATLILYREMGMSADNLDRIKESLEQIQYVFVRILPALAVISTLVVTWTSLLLSRPLLRRLNLFFPDFGSLNHWKSPDPLVWGVIGSGLMLLLPSNWIKLAGTNGLLILMTIYFFQGIAIISYYFEKKRFPRILRIFLYALIALQQFLLLLIIALGFFDVWLNFRRLPVDKSDG